MAENEVPVDSKYLPELMAEKDSIDPSFVHALRLISNEIEKIKNPQNNKENAQMPEGKEADMYNLHDQRLPKASCCIKVPTDVYPSVNFVGRLIGPGGSTLKGIQDVTSTRIGILGKGSMRDRKKADDLLKGGEAKYSHLNLPLHVKISGMGPLDQVYMNIGRAVNEICKLLHVDEEELAASDASRGRGMGRGGARGTFRGRGGSMRGAASGRGSSARGGTRGGRGSATGRGGGQSRGRGGAGRGFAKAQAAADPYATAQVETYGYEGYGAESYEGYGAEYADATSYDAYGAETYAADPYATEAAYGADAGYGADAYSYGDASYDAYGNGSADLTGAAQYASKPFRGKMRGSGRGRGSSKPY